MIRIFATIEFANQIQVSNSSRVLEFMPNYPFRSLVGVVIDGDTFVIFMPV